MSQGWQSVLDFWFGPKGTPITELTARWFVKDPAFDQEITRRFGTEMEMAEKGQLDGWASEPRSALALVVVCDQFYRNVYRNSTEAFSQDARALRVCLDGYAKGRVASLDFVERWIFSMPLTHAENAAVQQQSVQAFAALADDAKKANAPADVVNVLSRAHEYAIRHAQIVERFGRFPHRNSALGRTCTPDESEYLLTPPGA
jgi:uncharacterized protein (DUF924 family)